MAPRSQCHAIRARALLFDIRQHGSDQIDARKATSSRHDDDFAPVVVLIHPKRVACHHGASNNYLEQFGTAHGCIHRAQPATGFSVWPVGGSVGLPRRVIEHTSTD